MSYLIQTNYHTHTYLCRHGHGTVTEIVERALSQNYKAIGISDHAPLVKAITDKFYTRRMNFEDYNTTYLPALRQAKKKYSDKIKIYGGLEIEWYVEMRDYYAKFLKELDYLVLGQHGIVNRDGSNQSVYRNMDPDKIEVYTETVIEAMNSGYFQIIAHPEIFACRYREWDETCERCSRAIIQCAMDNQILLEVNANGIRGFTQYLQADGTTLYTYPYLPFWQLVAEMGATCIINDDAHEIEHIHDQATETAYQFASDLNLKVTDDLEFLKKLTIHNPR